MLDQQGVGARGFESESSWSAEVRKRKYECAVATFAGLLLTMDGEADTRRVLEGLGLTGWEAQDPEATEFMIDLMDTLMV